MTTAEKILTAEAPSASAPDAPPDFLRAVNRHIGQLLRQRREERKLSQNRLGQSCNLTAQQIQKYENGRDQIGAGRLYQLSRILFTEVGWFFQGLPAQLRPFSYGSGFSDTEQEALLDAPQPVNYIELQQLIDDYLLLPPAQRASLRQLVATMRAGTEQPD